MKRMRNPLVIIMAVFAVIGVLMTTVAWSPLTSGVDVQTRNAIGELRGTTVVKTASYTVKSGDCNGKLFIFRPIAAKDTLTLPTAVAGYRLSVFIADADSLVITTATGDSLITSAGAAWKTTTSVAGTIDLYAYDATRWLMQRTLGTWTSY